MNRILSIRTYYSNTPTVMKSSKLIRNEFLNYFKHDLGHTFIRSSPVVPLNDSTIPFVNAGMNQFKGIFLDYYDPPTKKAVNSQKCIRVSGKHNDLDIVGYDTYHHTFFEMLGSWSFGEYFKEEACRYAWDLLTKHYNINKEFLYVTYFGGDEKLELEPDLECRDIWLNIGIAKDKILPFGLQENFWEMGISGPCGPCTEIHIDYTKQLLSQSDQINKASAALTELWNIVFIQYLRLTDGTIVPLSKHYVDTGMGFERLVALLQGKKSNYDTDLFQPFFKAIQKYTKAPAYEGKFSNNELGLDNGYRVLADHSRMIAVALADGMVPIQSNKLRRIIRKAIDVGEKTFKKNGLLPELAYVVAESLGDVYPELQNNLKTIQKIMRFEEELYINLQNTTGKEWKEIVATRPELASIGVELNNALVSAYKYFQSTLDNLKATNTLTADVSIKLWQTFGLHEETIIKLAEVESLHFDSVGFQNEIENLRKQSRNAINYGTKELKRYGEILQKSHVPKTDDSFKYKYTYDGNNYQFPTIDSKIVALIVNDNIISTQNNESIYSTISKNTIDHSTSLNKNVIGIILDKTVCYTMTGGQEADKGFICTKDLTFNVESIRKVNDYVIHFITFYEDSSENWSDKLKIGDTCTVSIEPEFRTGIMQQHTGAHLLNACIKQIIQGVHTVRFRASISNATYRYHSFGERLSHEQLKEIENRINNAIKANVPITTKVLNSLELLAEDSVLLLSGAIYPYTGIRVVKIDAPDLKSKEACCGTHVSETGTLEYFCFVDYSISGRSSLNITAAVGHPAISAKLMGQDMQLKVTDLEQKLKTTEITYEKFKLESEQIKNEIMIYQAAFIPFLVKHDCLMKLKHLGDLAWIQAKDIEKSSIKMDMTNDMSTSFIVHCLRKKLRYLSFEDVVSLNPNIPILIIEYHNETIRAWCSVPQNIASKEFNARIWMNIILKIFKVQYKPTKDFNPLLVASMKPINISDAKHLLNDAIEEATSFAFTRTKYSLKSVLESKL